jgi:Leucine-rich repeat (LRR) protein
MIQAIFKTKTTMKRLLLILLCIPLIFNSCKKEEELDPIYIPDNNFEQALIDIGLDDVLDNYVTLIEYTNPNLSTQIGPSSLSLSNQNISDLTGIEGFVSLTDLSLYGNQLTSLNVSQNTNLRTLMCNNNQLTNLDVSGLTNLQNIECGENQLTSLDVSQNTDLYWLACYSNQLTSLDISNNTSLGELHAWDNQLISLDLRNGNNSILFESFNCSNNPNLTCISVDDSIFASSHLSPPYIDVQNFFSLSCP